MSLDDLLGEAVAVRHDSAPPRSRPQFRPLASRTMSSWVTRAPRGTRGPRRWADRRPDIEVLDKLSLGQLKVSAVGILDDDMANFVEEETVDKVWHEHRRSKATSQHGA